jgi:outer membrane protein OmpA-like peptidoglycan-associated protein
MRHGHGLCPGRRANAAGTSTKLTGRGQHSARCSFPRSIVATLVLAFAAALSLIATTPAWASDPFPVEETFRGAAFGSQWRHGGSAELTGANEAEGWLRLTSAAGGEFGYAYDNEAFPSTDGALVEFEYADWGGSGADGLTFFLFNGATSEAEFHAGQPGGSLGYASCNSSTNGLTSAYVGVGFDEYGNFTNLGSICGLDGTEFLANHVSVRGSAAESYRLLATAQTTESLRAERSQARRVTIAITPAGRLSVYIRYPDGTYQKVTEGFQLPAAPETLKFGYVASTGALTDDHEIRNAQVLEPTQLTPSVMQTAGGEERGKPLTWTAVVRNEGPNPTQREQLRASTGEQSLSDVTWTCEASTGAECTTVSGTGLPSLEAGAMPQGSSLTYKITGIPTPTSDYAQMTIESEPRGDTGELDPEKERASTKTDLTPLFEKEPTFTLTANGEASATTASALGGDISYSYAWQRCEADGSSCADIAGAEASTYHTTNADIGHTIRFTQTASNSAGSSTIDSAIYELPTAEITSAPARYVATREAVLSFISSPREEATLECSLDGAAWSQCASSTSYADLAEGEHTFSVRAVYGGLSNPHPTSVQWTVEATPPPAPNIVSAPSSPSAQTDPTFEFGSLIEGATLECQLDGGGWSSCGASTELIDLTNGEHDLQAREVNRAGLDSTVTSYAWTIDTTPPLSPFPVSAPAPESTPPSGGISTLECSLDGGPYVECASGANPKGLSKGWHTLTVRKVSATGALSSVTTHRWHVADKHEKHEKRRHAGRHKTARREHAPRHKTARRKHKTARRQHATRHTHHATRRQHAAKRGRHAITHKPTPKHKPKAKTHRPASKSRSRAKPRRAVAKAKKSPPAAAPTHKSRPPSGASSAPANKATAHHTGAPHSKTHRPTERHTSGVKTPTTDKTPPPAGKTPAPSSKPKAKGSPPAHSHGPSTRRSLPTPPRRPRTKRSSPATTHEPKAKRSPPGNRHSPKAKTPSTADSSRPKGSSPAHSPKTHAPATTRTSKEVAQRKARARGANPVIRPFKPRSSALSRRARRKIERIAAEMMHARRIVCIGYTDDLGTRSENLTLGLERARAVCAKLRALGVHAALRVQSGGEARPCASNATARGRALNRRVELRITY